MSFTVQTEPGKEKPMPSYKAKGKSYYVTHYRRIIALLYILVFYLIEIFYLEWEGGVEDCHMKSGYNGVMFSM